MDCESFVKKKKMHTMSSFSLPMVEVGSLSATRSMLSFRLDSQPATLSRLVICRALLEGLVFFRGRGSGVGGDFLTFH